MVVKRLTHTQARSLREALKKKLRDYLGIFPKRRTPPLLGTPCSKKMCGDFVIFFLVILG